MARDSGSFRRSAARLKPQPRILIVCEDSKSGLRYLKDASYDFRVDEEVEITHCGKTDPKGIVEYGLRRSAKFDKVYCVIDRDTHPNFDAALVLARKAGKLDVIASFPCFEYWLLLHYKYTRRPYANSGRRSGAERLIKDLQKCSGMAAYDKGSEQKLYAQLKPQLGDARMRAKRSFAEARKVNSFNPSTRVHELLEELEKLSELQKKQE